MIVICPLAVLPIRTDYQHIVFDTECAIPSQLFLLDVIPSMSNATQHLAYSADDLKQLARDVLAHAKQLGATDCAVDVSEGSGLTVNVRKGRVETIEQNRDKGIGVSVYINAGGKAVQRGHASTSDFSMRAVRETVEAAYHIARFTAADDCAALPEDHLFDKSARDFDLYHPWNIDVEQAIVLGKRAEAAAFETSSLIRNSDGASVSAQHSHFISANSRGFMGGYPYSRHSLSVAPIAGRKARSSDGMQRDDWYVSMRDPAELPDPESIGRYAAQRALARLDGRALTTRSVPVLFEAPLATGLLGAFTQAASGGALYRKSSFLVDSLGKRMFAKHIDVIDNPHIPKAMGSASFDEEGVKTQRRSVVERGVIRGYFLSTYSARKLGMQTTGNAGGSHNLDLISRTTQPGDDLPAMLKKMHTGLLVTDLMGQGVNYVTGDYSRGAFGYWVENGEIVHAVEEITIASSLQAMFAGIVAVGADRIVRGNKGTGSVLIDAMTIAGA